MILQTSLLIFMLLFMGCERKVQRSDSTQVSKGAISALQSEYISQLNPYTVKAGQFVHVVETQEVISSQSPIKNYSKEWVVDVTELENFEETRLLTTIKKVTDKLYDEFFIYEIKNVYSLQQINPQELINKLGIAQITSESLLKQAQVNTTDTEVKVDGISYQNLRTSIVSLVPPKKVQESENCQGLPNCKISANLITYEIVFRFSDNSQQTISVEWYLSTEVPFFAALLKQCTTSLVPVDKVRVLVKQCSEVVDFKNE